MTTLQSRFIDYAKNKSTVGVYVPTAITNADALLLNAAIAGLSLGTNEEAAIIERVPVFDGASTAPTNKVASRSQKALVRYSDTVNNKDYSFTIPCADPNLKVGNTNMVDMANGAGLLLKTRFEAHAVSELGNPVVVNSIEIIGRSAN